MKGTLALWYEPVGDGAPPVEVELHLNLWRDLPSRTNFLDVGMMFDGTEAMTRFYLYVPAIVREEHVSDLFGVLRSGLAANAVFNDVVTFGAEADHRYEIVRGGATDTVFEVRSEELTFQHDQDAVFGAGTRITFTEPLCERFKAVQTRRYVRFRIRLIGESSATFSSELVARDRAFASSAGRLELTEFRLNERRSYPTSIIDRTDAGRFRIKVIHYFLIRDLEHELVVQHARFEKVRRLEAALWADYVAGVYSSGASRLTARVAARLVIYHWKVKEKSLTAEEEAALFEAGAVSAGGPVAKPGIGDFIAFASFRTSSTHLAWYALVIVALGAAGSLVATIFTQLFVTWSSKTGIQSPVLTLAAEWRLLGTIAVLIGLAAYWSVLKTKVLGAVRWVWREIRDRYVSWISKRFRKA